MMDFDACAAPLQGDQVKVAEPEVIEAARGRPSVDVIGHVDGQHGGVRYLARRRWGLSWGSDYSQFPNALQGDPRWFIEIAGPAIAKFFGFEILGPDLMTIPSPAELNGAIKKVNQVLAAMGKPPIPLFFTDAPETDLAPKSYAQFTAAGLVPMAISGNVQVHDVSYHAATLYLPPPLLWRAQLREKLILDFEALLVQKYPRLAQDPMIQKLLSKLFIQSAANMDFGTGNFSRSLVFLASDPNPDNLPVEFFEGLLRLEHGDKLNSCSGPAGRKAHYELLDWNRRLSLHSEYEAALAEFWSTREELRSQRIGNFHDPRSEPEAFAEDWGFLGKAQKVAWVQGRVAEVNQAVGRILSGEFHCY